MSYSMSLVHDIPRSDALLPLLFPWYGNKKPQGVAKKGAVFEYESKIQKLEQYMKSYHAVHLERRALGRRLIILNQIRLLLNSMPRTNNKQIMDADSLKSFSNHVNIRCEYYQTLNKYLNNPQKQVKIEMLLGVAYAWHQNLHHKKQNDRYLSLHTSKVFEKIDPLHRSVSGGGQNALLTKNYQNYLEQALKKNPNINPVEALVDFLLGLDSNKKVKAETSYFSDAQRETFRIKFEKSKVMALYCQRNQQYERYDPQSNNAGLVNQWGPYHTYFPDPGLNNVSYKGQQMRNTGELDLLFADLYAVRRNTLYTYPYSPAGNISTRRFHSNVLAGKAVQAAGMIVSRKGKIVAIDNKSGHYQPSWRHLEQVVTLIRKERAFDKDGFVGVCYGEGSVFMLVSDFRLMAQTGFQLYQAMEAAKRGWDHVFRPDAPKHFSRILSKYTEIGHGMETALDGFLNFFYPQLQSRFAEMRGLAQRSLWGLNTFFGKKVLAGTGLTLKLDNKLKEYHRVYNEMLKIQATIHRVIPIRQQMREIEKSATPLLKPGNTENMGTRYILQNFNTYRPRFKGETQRKLNDLENKYSNLDMQNEEVSSLGVFDIIAKALKVNGELTALARNWLSGHTKWIYTRARKPVDKLVKQLDSEAKHLIKLEKGIMFMKSPR